MTGSEDAPEADRAPGAPHPRETAQLIGQEPAQSAFLEAYNAGRLHHAWMITGPKGVGKATLAWRIARFLLATPPSEAGLFGAPELPATLDIPPTHPVCQRMRALSEPRLYLLRRPWDEKSERLRAEITVDEVRKLKSFFALSAADGGRRVVIVDAADEMNVNAANALLKLLEEPPENTILLLISHQPSRLLPTILSRCRMLRCQNLAPDQIAQVLAASGAPEPDQPEALAALAGGSAGAALRLIALDGLDLYAQIIAIFTKNVDRTKASTLADSAAGRAQVDRLDLMIELFEFFLTRLARTGVSGPVSPEAAPGETAVLCKMSPDPRAGRIWATTQQTLGQRARHARAVNLDPAALILDIVLKIQETAAEMPR